MELKTANSFIDEKWLSTDREQLEIMNPYNQEKIGVQYAATTEDVDRALAVSFEQKKRVKEITAYERANILKKAAQLLDDRKMEFATIISSELGKPLKNTLDEVDRSVETLELSGEEAKRLHGETLPDNSNVSTERSTSSNVFFNGLPNSLDIIVANSIFLSSNNWAAFFKIFALSYAVISLTRFFCSNDTANARSTSSVVAAYCTPIFS